MTGPNVNHDRRKVESVDHWFRSTRVPMSYESYKRLPWHPAYKFEYWDGQLRISPRWRSHSVF